jgi:hypothetical protein
MNHSHANQQQSSPPSKNEKYQLDKYSRVIFTNCVTLKVFLIGCNTRTNFTDKL